MAQEVEIKGFSKVIDSLNKTAQSTAKTAAQSEVAQAAFEGAFGDLASMPLFKSLGSATLALGGQLKKLSLPSLPSLRGEKKSAGPKRDDKGRFIGSGPKKDSDNIKKTKEASEKQLQILEGNEEEEKIERVRNLENRKEMTSVLTRIVKGVETLADGVTSVESTKADSGGGGLLGFISSIFGLKAFASFAAFGKTLKTVFPKLFLPFTVILAAVEFVKGFVKGFEEGGFLEGVKQGFQGVISSFIDVPLNLLKDLVAWIAGKLGFEGVEERLNEFNFDMAGLFGKAFDKARDFFTNTVIPFVTENLHFGDIMEKVDEFIIQPVKNMFNSIIEFLSNIKIPSFSEIKEMLPGLPSLFGGDEETENLETQNGGGFMAAATQLADSALEKASMAASSAAKAVVTTVNNVSSGGGSTTVIPTGFDTSADPSMARVVGYDY